MHPAVYRRFEHLFDEFPPAGNAVLEIGVSPEPPHALLSAFQRRSPDFDCVGVNLDVPTGLELPYRVVPTNANEMSCFADRSFDAVVCNAMLEHDPFFWKTLGEVRRLLRDDGLFFVGVPGFRKQPNSVHRALGVLQRAAKARRVPGLRALADRAMLTPLVATTTFMFHAHPYDYYRFSEQAVREVFLAELECLHLEYVLTPVRILAVGRKTA